MMDHDVDVVAGDPHKAPAISTIDLSSDEEVFTNTTEQHSDSRKFTVSASPGPDVDVQSDDGQSETESIYEDLLNSEEADQFVRTADPDICSPEEADEFRTLLRKIGPSNFIYQTITNGTVRVKKLCAAFGVKIPEWMDERPEEENYRLLGLLIVRELTRRRKLPQYNTIDDAVKLLQKSKKILVITGAGISTNLGVPDFRSKDNGFYTKLREEGFDDPQAIFEISNFEEDPSQFYHYASETLPMQGKSSPTHAFIRLLQDRDQLLTNYTQNIDNVEGNVGIEPNRLIQCHGSWATFTCRKCKFTTSGEQFHSTVKAKKIPQCPQCIASIRDAQHGPLKRKRRGGSKPRKRHSDDDSDDDGQYDIPEPGVMKPNITFFGEKLPDTFFDRFKGQDVDDVDLLVVIGTSMKVAPVSEIPLAIKSDVPQIYISRDPCRHIQFDVVLLGDCDVITGELAKRAKWQLEHHMLPEERTVEVDKVEGAPGTWKVSASDTRASTASSRPSSISR